jgi:hypothetical protein
LIGTGRNRGGDDLGRRGWRRLDEDLDDWHEGGHEDGEGADDNRDAASHLAEVTDGVTGRPQHDRDDQNSRENSFRHDRYL